MQIMLNVGENSFATRPNYSSLIFKVEAQVIHFWLRNCVTNPTSIEAKFKQFVAFTKKNQC